MTNNSTHLLRTFPSKDATQLIRLIDGAVIGVRQGVNVQWGEDAAQQQRRTFMDVDHAIRCLRRVANADQNMVKGTFCKTCGMLPHESVTCPESNDGAHRLEYSPVARIEEYDGESRVARPN